MRYSFIDMAGRRHAVSGIVSKRPVSVSVGAAPYPDQTNNFNERVQVKYPHGLPYRGYGNKAQIDSAAYMRGRYGASALTPDSGWLDITDQLSDLAGLDIRSIAIDFGDTRFSSQDGGVTAYLHMSAGDYAGTSYNQIFVHEEPADSPGSSTAVRSSVSTVRIPMPAGSEFELSRTGGMGSEPFAAGGMFAVATVALAAQHAQPRPLHPDRLVVLLVAVQERGESHVVGDPGGSRCVAEAPVSNVAGDQVAPPGGQLAGAWTCLTHGLE